MSTIDPGADTAPIIPGRFWGHDRSRISWGAVFAGAVIAVAATMLFSLLGVALGTGSIRALDIASTELAKHGIGTGVWEIVNLVVSMALGGYVAARLSGTHSHLDAELHGMTMWGLALILGSVLVAQGNISTRGLFGQGRNYIESRTLTRPETISGRIGLDINPSATIEQLQKALGAGDDPTAMSHEQINAEISALIGNSLFGTLSDTDRDRLAALVAAQYSVPKEEALRRVIRMDNDAKAVQAQVEKQAAIAVEELDDSAAAASRVLVTALTAGLLAALFGAWIGTRHKRVLHPVLDHAHDTHAFYQDSAGGY